MSIDIICKNEKQKLIIIRIIEICQSNNSYLPNNLEIIVKDKEINLNLKSCKEESFIKVPFKLFIPFNKIKWSVNLKQKLILYKSIGLSSTQLELLKLHVELYNSLEKLKYWENESIIFNEISDSNLKEIILDLKPNFVHTIKDYKIKSNSSKNFINSRLFYIKKKKAKFIIPIFDFINHSCEGENYKFVNDNLLISNSATKSSKESLISYGSKKDTLDISLLYNFVDFSNCLVNSAPLEINVADIGVIKILGINKNTNKKYLDLPEFNFNNRTLTLSHMVFNSKRPEKLFNVLKFILLIISKKHNLEFKINRESIKEIINLIIKKNLILLDHLLCKTYKNKKSTQILNLSVAHQIKNLKKSTL